jgi:hypothetical protein
MSYSQSKNISNTTPIPSIVINNAPLSFYKLDDGVMGGQSMTHDHLLQTESEAGGIIFTGKINTNGGGFASIRSQLENGIPSSAKGLKLKYKGDGKTYKILISDGKGGGPFSSSPTWQCDFPTEVDQEGGERCVYFENFEPSFGGRSTLHKDEKKKYKFVNEEMKQIGLMLSLKLSNGDANPVETFGNGIFDFKLEVEHMELV